MLALPTCVKLDGDPCRVLNSLGCAVRRVPLQPPAESRVRAKVNVVQSLRHVDAASWEARTNQNHRLVIIGGQAAAMLAVPFLGDFDRRRQVVDFLRLLAPSALLIFWL